MGLKISQKFCKKSAKISFDKNMVLDAPIAATAPVLPPLYCHLGHGHQPR